MEEYHIDRIPANLSASSFKVTPNRKKIYVLLAEKKKIEGSK